MLGGRGRRVPGGRRTDTQGTAPGVWRRAAANHDVSVVLSAEHERLAASLRDPSERLAAISKELRRDHELAFYGTEDLTPSSFYAASDAVRARDAARFAVSVVAPAVLGQS